MDTLEATLKVLEGISQQYDRSSRESESIELAAWALIFVKREETRTKFLDFVKSLDRDLNEHEKHYLRSMGIDPNAPKG